MTRGMRVISNHSSAFCLKHLMAIHSHTFTAVEILWTVPSPLWHLIHLGLADRWYQLFATAPPQPFNTFMHFQSISTLVAFANKAHIQSIAAREPHLSHQKQTRKSGHRCCIVPPIESPHQLSIVSTHCGRQYPSCDNCHKKRKYRAWAFEGPWEKVHCPTRDLRGEGQTHHREKSGSRHHKAIRWILKRQAEKPHTYHLPYHLHPFTIHT